MELNPVSNNKLTLLRKLNRKKYRYREQLFTIEGERSVEQVIENRTLTLEGLFFDANQKLWTKTGWQSRLDRFESSSLDPADFMEITDTDNPQGVLALCRIPAESTVRELTEKPGVLIATDSIQDPGNLGTMIRTASWFGVNGMLAGKGTVDLFHPKVVRSTAGATGTIPYLNADLKRDLTAFEREGWKVVLLDAGPGTRELRTLEKSGKMILVVGNEANGISSSLTAGGRTKGCIGSPVAAPYVESLNASIALSIALYAFSD